MLLGLRKAGQPGGLEIGSTSVRGLDRLAALVAVAEAMVAARVPVTRPILFAATVGEEGSGDLRGVKHLLNGKHDLAPAAFIALDGAGLDIVGLGVAESRGIRRGVVVNLEAAVDSIKN